MARAAISGRAGRAGQPGGGPWPRGVFLSGQAALWRDDSLAYTEAKSDLILDLLDQAEQWAAHRHWPG